MGRRPLDPEVEFLARLARENDRTRAAEVRRMIRERMQAERANQSFPIWRSSIVKRVSLGFLAAFLLALSPSLVLAQTQTLTRPTVVFAATGSTGAVVATMPAKASSTNYICGFDISGVGSAVAPLGPVTIAGTAGGSLVYQGIPAGTAAAPSSPFMRNFDPCIPASAQNTAITVTTTADGTGTAVAVQAYGFSAQ
jgi:hypothetical protein